MIPCKPRGTSKNILSLDNYDFCFVCSRLAISVVFASLMDGYISELSVHVHVNVHMKSDKKYYD